MAEFEETDSRYHYGKYRAVLNGLSTAVRDAMYFIAHNPTLDAVMDEIPFRGEEEAALILRKGMEEANAPASLLTELTLDDLKFITLLYSPAMALLLREDKQSPFE